MSEYRKQSSIGHSLFRVEELERRDTPSIAIRLDYSYDTYGFFNDSTRRAALQTAVNAIAPYINDNLSAITPSGGNSWQAIFQNPISGQTVTLNNLNVAANEIVVFVGGGDLGSQELGLVTAGGFSASGSQGWLDLLSSRGQPGALLATPTDYSTWGGMITFSRSSNFYYGSGTPGSNQYDFVSVAEHELLHMFGFGIGGKAFSRYVGDWNGSSGHFAGPTVVNLMGSSVSVAGDSSPEHWAQGTTYRGSESPIVPALAPGRKNRVTALDFAALNDMGWLVSSSVLDGAVKTAAPVVVPVVSTNPAATTSTSPRVAIGTSNGAIVTDANGQTVLTATIYESTFTGGVRTVSADLNRDGTPDLIAVNGVGRAADVVVINGRTGKTLVTFRAFEETFTGGAYVALGDLSGDGVPDVIVTPDQGGGPVVAIYDGAALGSGKPTERFRFFGIEDVDFRGGDRVTTGDFNGDGVTDLAVAAGYQGGPRVALFDGKALRNQNLNRLVGDFFAADPSVRNGVYLAAGDIDRDGSCDLVVGSGPGNGSRVTVYRGRELLFGRQTALIDFTASSSGAGASLATADLDSDGVPDLIVGTGAGNEGQITIYSSAKLLKGLSSVLRSIASPLPDGVEAFAG